MRRLENLCVDCGLPCIGERCIHKNVSIDYCDECEEIAAYHFDSRDLCRIHAHQYLDEIWSSLSPDEKADLLNISQINDN